MYQGCLAVVTTKNVSSDCQMSLGVGVGRAQLPWVENQSFNVVAIQRTSTFIKRLGSLKNITGAYCKGTEANLKEFPVAKVEATYLNNEQKKYPKQNKILRFIPI